MRSRERSRSGPGARIPRGFALVEILCALLILGFGLVGLTEAITYALRMSKESEYQTQASLLAAGRLEEIRADKFLSAGSRQGSFTGVFSHFAWTEDITETTTEGLYQVRIEIALADGAVPVYELETLLFDPPYASTLSTSSDGKLEKERRLEATRGAAAAGERSP